MPTIRVTTVDGQRCFAADRVLRDSQVLVVEERRAVGWVRVATFRTADVVDVRRLVVHGQRESWLTEDVRVAAGLDARPGDQLAVPSGRGRLPTLRRRPGVAR